MVHDGCWSTVICSARDRAELGDTSDAGWVLGCRLSIGHSGDHATDAETVPRFDRRRWLEWNDHESHAQSLIERNPCPGGIGAPCMLFDGHGGVHWYAPTNGYLTAAGSGRWRTRESAPGPSATGGHAQHDLVDGSTDIGSHRVHDDLYSGSLNGVHPTSVEFADIPSMRARAVRAQPPVDTPATSHSADTSHHASGDLSVTAALDAVVVALGRLAQALRAAEDDRRGHLPG